MKAQAILTVIGVVLAAATFAGQIPPNVFPIDPQTRKISYQGVVTLEHVAAYEFYTRAKLWIATTYRSAKPVIVLDNKEAGRIVVNGIFAVPSGWNYRSKLTIEVKDGRFRYLLTDLVRVQAPPAPDFPVERMVNEPSVDHRTWEQIDVGCREIVASLIKAMSVPATSHK